MTDSPKVKAFMRRSELETVNYVLLISLRYIGTESLIKAGNTLQNAIERI